MGLRAEYAFNALDFMLHFLVGLMDGLDKNSWRFRIGEKSVKSREADQCDGFRDHLCDQRLGQHIETTIKQIFLLGDGIDKTDQKDILFRQESTCVCL